MNVSKVDKMQQDGPPNMHQAFWGRLQQFASKLRLESVSIGSKGITFSGAGALTPSFDQIRERIEKTRVRPRDVFVISAHNVDEITIVDRIEPDHECEALRGPVRRTGGSGANTAYALARLGASVGVAGIVGSDRYGTMLRKDLCDVGADAELVLIGVKFPTGRTTTLVDREGKRLIVVHPGINDKFGKTADLATLRNAALASRVLHLSSFVGRDELYLQERLVQDVRSQTLVSLTPGALYARRGLGRLEQILRFVDIMFLYREQLRQLINSCRDGPVPREVTTNELLIRLFQWRKRHQFDSPVIIVVKDPLESSSGGVGREFLTVGVGRQSLEGTFSPQPLAADAHFKAVDLTGAGDGAAAGFLYGVLQSASLESCVDLSFLIASFVSTRLGARKAF
ncbi:MAG TPA: PfkB family carbohydrate kinase [Chthoniobacterales bacterium]|nr:PfkB family carbohydrate kinase [Chthoniobacterales bacterium]